MLTDTKASTLLMAVAVRSAFLLMTALFGTWLAVRVLVMYLADPRGFRRLRNRTPPACLKDPRYGEHHYATVNGVRLHYVTKGQKGAPLILMIHGYPECWWSWRHQLERFGESYYAVAFDTRGYNESEKPTDVSQYREEVLIEDVRALIEHLGYEKAIVIAHDWGAGQAWQFADSYPAMVEKLIVMDCPPIAWRLYRLATPSQFHQGWRTFFYQLPVLPEFAFKSHDMQWLEDALTSQQRGVPDNALMSSQDIDVYKYVFSQPNGWTCAMNYYRAALTLHSIIYRMKQREKHNSQPVHIQAKTLIIWGSKDAFVDLVLAYESQQFCDDSEVKVIEGASHWVQQHCPEAVNDAILKFLQE